MNCTPRSYLPRGECHWQLMCTHAQPLSEHETIWPAASNSKHSQPLLEYTSVGVLRVHFELMNPNFLCTPWLPESPSLTAIFRMFQTTILFFFLIFFFLSYYAEQKINSDSCFAQLSQLHITFLSECETPPQSFCNLDVCCYTTLDLLASIINIQLKFSDENKNWSSHSGEMQRPN